MSNIDFEDIMRESLSSANELVSKHSEAMELARTMMICRVIDEELDVSSMHERSEATATDDSVSEEIVELRNLVSNLNNQLETLEDAQTQLSEAISDIRVRISQLESRQQKDFESDEEDVDDVNESDHVEEDDDSEDEADSESDDGQENNDSDDIVRMEASDEDNALSFDPNDPPMFSQSGLEDLSDNEIKELAKYYEVFDSDHAIDTLRGRVGAAQKNEQADQPGSISTSMADYTDPDAGRND